MPNLDDELRRRMHRAGRRVETEGLEERLHGRRARKRLTQKAGHGLLAVAVVAGSAVGIAGLNRAFRGAGGAIGDAVGSGTVAFVRNVRGCQGIPDAGDVDGLQLFTVDVATGEERNVPLHYRYHEPRRITSPEAPDFSPDGSRVAWRDRYTGGLFVSDVATGATQHLANGLVVAGGPGWSPDGATLLVTGRDTRLPGFGATAIYTMNADGSDIARLTDGELAIWTNDGRIAFMRRPTASVEIDPDTGEVLSMNSGTVTYLLMNADGTGIEERYSSPGDVPIGSAAWAPDGSRIVGDATLHRNTDIYTVDLRTRVPFRLTDDPAQDTSPTWSPDGSMIAFQSGRWGTGVGHSEIAVMNADGSGIRRLTHDCWDDFFPTWIANDAAVRTLPLWPPTSESSPVPSSVPSDVATGDADAPAIPGLTGKVCNVASVQGDFAGDGTPDTAYSYSLKGSGACAQRWDGGDRISIAPNGGDVVMTAGPLACDPACSLAAVVDVNSDGRQELAIGVDNYYPTTPVQLEILAVVDGPDSQQVLAPVTIEGRGVPMILLYGTGGAGTWSDGVECRTDPPRIVTFKGISPDAGSTWQVHRTIYGVTIDPAAGVAQVRIESRVDYAAANEDPRFPGRTLCGAEVTAG